MLLDSAFAHPRSFPKLGKKANLAHTVHDYGMSPEAEDEHIYQKAIQENRFILTINFKHFRRLIKGGRPGVLGIDSQLTNLQIDNTVSSYISGKDPDDFIGKAVKI